MTCERVCSMCFRFNNAQIHTHHSHVHASIARRAKYAHMFRTVCTYALYSMKEENAVHDGTNGVPYLLSHAYLSVCYVDLAHPKTTPAAAVKAASPQPPGGRWGCCWLSCSARPPATQPRSQCPKTVKRAMWASDPVGRCILCLVNPVRQALCYTQIGALTQNLRPRRRLASVSGILPWHEHLVPCGGRW